MGGGLVEAVLIVVAANGLAGIGATGGTCVGGMMPTGFGAGVLIEATPVEPVLATAKLERVLAVRWLGPAIRAISISTNICLPCRMARIEPLPTRRRMVLNDTPSTVAAASSDIQAIAELLPGGPWRARFRPIAKSDIGDPRGCLNH
jgi:hypothetical protein